MAMINCPYCNEKISSTNTRCFYCGKELTTGDVARGLSQEKKEFEKKIQQSTSPKSGFLKTETASKKEKSVSNLFHSWMESSPVYVKKNNRSGKMVSFMLFLFMMGWLAAMFVPLIMTDGEDVGKAYTFAKIGLIISLVVSVGFLAYFSRFTFVPLYNVRMMVESVKTKKINVNPSIKALIDPFRSGTEDKAVEQSIIPSFFTAMCLLDKKAKRPLVIKALIDNFLLVGVVCCLTLFCYGMAFVFVDGWNLKCTISLVLLGVVLVAKIFESLIFGEVYRLKIVKFLKKEYPVEYNIGL